VFIRLAFDPSTPDTVVQAPGTKFDAAAKSELPTFIWRLAPGELVRAHDPIAAVAWQSRTLLLRAKEGGVIPETDIEGLLVGFAYLSEYDEPAEEVEAVATATDFGTEAISEFDGLKLQAELAALSEHLKEANKYLSLRLRRNARRLARLRAA
jgi:hypothetical protein